MAYATVADLVRRFGEAEVIRLTDREATGDIDAEVAEAALDDATTEADAYLGVRYALPLDPTPPLVRRLVCDIARYRLAHDADLLTEEMGKRFEANTRLLRALSRGEAVLGSSLEPEPATSDLAMVKAAPRRLDADSLEGF
jgi:phage gp36-like protein